jgi:peptidoglycan/LPS O-acetylase OafA/YrhL
MTLNSNQRLSDGLSSIRFLGALAMLCIHVVIFLMIFGFKTPNGGDFLDSKFPLLGFYDVAFNNVFNVGERVIKLFFILSGFLLSYPFFQDKEPSTTVKIKRYFKNRAARILPLYFFMIVVWFFILPNLSFFSPHQNLVADYTHFYSKLLAYVLLSPHTIELLAQNIPYAQVAWSVGVECWFYILLPLFFILPYKRSLVLGFGINLLYVLILTLHELEKTDSSFLQIINKEDMRLFLHRLSIVDFSTGIVFAWLAVKHQPFVKKFFSALPIQLFAYAGALYLLFIYNSGLVSFLLMSVFLGSIIVKIASSPKNSFPLNSKLLVKAGDYAYSIYLWHPILIYINMAVAERFFNIHVVTMPIFLLLLLGSISSTIIVAKISYTFIEKPFLIKFRQS